MGRLGTLALKSLGLLVLAFVAFSVIATIVGIVLGIVTAVVSLVVSVAVLGLLILGGIKLASMLGDDDPTPETFGTPTGTERSRDPKSQLRDQYVSGELSEAEFERELDRLMDSSDRPGSRSGSTRSSDLERDRR
ncbi:hypothetical protein [Halopiger goleimassiliensis]|uniref:hypothetical protein n=1 Tax=Halopiger goleimassiliensis TaxID=1293048 RepID=UPI000677E9B4|nr:hypothetical protein [Halopiger goleimassiliensis]